MIWLRCSRANDGEWGFVAGRMLAKLSCAVTWGAARALEDIGRHTHKAEREERDVEANAERSARRRLDFFDRAVRVHVLHVLRHQAVVFAEISRDAVLRSDDLVVLLHDSDHRIHVGLLQRSQESRLIDIAIADRHEWREILAPLSHLRIDGTKRTRREQGAARAHDHALNRAALHRDDSCTLGAGTNDSRITTNGLIGQPTDKGVVDS